MFTAARQLGYNTRKSLNRAHTLLSTPAPVLLNRNDNMMLVMADAMSNGEQKRFFETTETRINVAHSTNAVRKEMYGEPALLNEKKAHAARKGIYRLKGKRKQWVWSKNKTRKTIEAENSEKNPKGTKNEIHITEEDRAYMDRIKECSKETGRMDEAVNCYHMMGIRPDTHVYLDLLNVFLVNSTPEKNYLGEALQIYQDIKLQALQPSLDIYILLMDLCLMRKHLPRGIYVFKEFLSHIRVAKRSGKNWERQADKYARLHKTLLKICYETNNAERAAAIFEQILHHHSHVISYMSGETYATKNPTVSFVKSFVEDEEEAESFAYRMREALKGHVTANDTKPLNSNYDNMSHSELVSSMANNTALSPALRASFAAMASTEDIYDDESNRGLIESTLDDAPFFNRATHFHETDPTISKVHLEFARNVLEASREEFNDFATGNPRKEKLLGVTDDEAELLLANAKEHMEYQLEEAMSLDELHRIHEEFSDAKRHIQDRLNNRLNWKPVVIGVDGLPFFPTCIDPNRITGEAIRAAKRQYLNSIEDPEVRTDVENEFSDRIKLCWFDVDKKQIIDGLYY